MPSDTRVWIAFRVVHTCGGCGGGRLDYRLGIYGSLKAATARVQRDEERCKLPEVIRAKHLLGIQITHGVEETVVHNED